MKHNRNPLYTAVHYALGVGVVAGLAITAAPAVAQDEAAELDRVQVTGSRITRTDIEGALPVTVIDREAIELSGHQSIGDLLRETTFNSFGSFRPQSGSSFSSASLVSLRGLGSSRTLILVDGRRIPLAPNVGSAADVNAIPIGAVERVEILADGASAVYGSDAIGGVVNIITRKDYDGAQLMYNWTDPKRDGGKQRGGHVMFGTSGDRGRILAVASKNSRSIVFARQRPWSQSEIGSDFANSQNISIFGNTYRDVGRFFDEPDAFEGETAAAPGCENTPDFYEMPEAGVFFPGNTGTGCFYDFPQISADDASYGTTGLMVNADYEINRDWRLYSRMSVSRVESFGRYAPAPDALVLPASSPNNPYDSTVIIYHRYAALGPRDTEIDSNVYGGLIGAEGRVGMVDLDFGVNYSEYKYNELGRNYLVRPVALEYLADGTYDIFDPLNNDPDVLNSMKATISRASVFKIEEYYGSATMDVFNMPAGPVSAAVGVEYRREDYVDRYDSLQEAGAIGGSAGNSAGGDRTIKSAYTEWLFPLMDRLEMTLALRYDDYSDYGDDLSPKIAFRYQPLDNLTLRASYGEGFAAPSLDILTQLDSFSAASLNDFVICDSQGIPESSCPSIQTNSFSIANPDLDSESSRQYSFGVAYEPFTWLNGSMDYYNIRIKDVISFFSAQALVNRERALQPFPPGLGVFRNDPLPGQTVGSIDFIQTGFGNEGTLEIDGIDTNLRTNFNFGDAGRLQNNLQIGFVRELKISDSLTEIDTANNARQIGRANQPRFRGKLENVYSFGDFNFAWNINYISKTARTLQAFQSDGVVTARAKVGKVGSWVTHDLQANWFAPWNAQVTVGVRNLADRDPPLNPTSNRDYNFSLYDGWGRVPYVRYTQNF